MNKNSYDFMRDCFQNTGVNKLTGSIENEKRTRKRKNFVASLVKKLKKDILSLQQ
jgi:hypothetical protein